MWRPKDWENPQIEVLTKSPTYTSEIYEAGADAMHRATVNWLKEMNISENINDCLVIEGNAFLEFIKEDK